MSTGTSPVPMGPARSSYCGGLVWEGVFAGGGW